MQNNRNSSIELLRVISMIMILTLHVNFLSLGAPTTSEITTFPVQTFTRFFIHYLCIVGVNVFVFISGWFGINYKTKGLYSYLFQCLFFSIAIFIAFALTGGIEMTRRNIMSSFMLYKNAYWFVWAYLVLYIMSPILNSFIKTSSKSEVKRILILFFIIQTILSMFSSLGFYQAGYSPLSFFGLYLLARYYRLYKESQIKGKYIYLLIFLLCATINTLASFLPPFIGVSSEIVEWRCTMYVNPINIIGALSLLLFFTRLNFSSKIINYIATSCFAVYLLHMHFCVSGYYIDMAKYIFNNFSGCIYLLAIVILFILVFVVSIIIDRIRILCFKHLWNKYESLKYQTKKHDE